MRNTFEFLTLPQPAKHCAIHRYVNRYTKPISCATLLLQFLDQANQNT